MLATRRCIQAVLVRVRHHVLATAVLGRDVASALDLRAARLVVTNLRAVAVVVAVGSVNEQVHLSWA